MLAAVRNTPTILAIGLDDRDSIISGRTLATAAIKPSRDGRWWWPNQIVETGIYNVTVQ
jgi:hypothetical protein